MGRIILVHGAWGDARTWDDTIPFLTAAGHDVTAVTLPGHGDGRAPGEVGLAEYGAHVAALARAGEPALLVGHSMGGMAISAAAELAPEAARKLVYVAATLPLSGQSLLDLVKRQATRGVADAVRPAPERGATVLDGAAAAPVLFQDATEAQRDRAIAGFVTQPNRGQTDRITLGARFAAVPRAYVFCTEDLTITYPLQQEMVAATPCAETFTMTCGHCPQVSRPAELAGILSRL